MKAKGFTLIELMIVVAIIAIIAAIAIPNLLRSRMASNETAAAASCKAYASAQAIYRRTDWDKDSTLEYAGCLHPAGLPGGGADPAECNMLDVNGEVINLIDAAFAGSDFSLGANAVPKSGYFFQVLHNAVTPVTRLYYPAGSENMTAGYAMYAAPATWDGTGRNSFQISDAGTIYQFDEGVQSTAAPTGFDITYNGAWIVTE